MQFDPELDVLPEISRYGVEERLRAVYLSELFGYDVYLVGLLIAIVILSGYSQNPSGGASKTS
jgi:hypothetical protein